MNFTVGMVEVIQAMLAPGIMISACGLLLLGMNNKYSLVVNRIRLLNEEKRRFVKRAEDESFTFVDEVRINSIAHQLTHLQGRLKLVRNAVLCYCVAVALFVSTSLLIGVEFVSQTRRFDFVIINLFSLGMISVFTGIIFAAFESKKGYDIVAYEIASND